MSADARLPATDDARVACFDALYAAHQRVVYAYLLGHVVSVDAAVDLLQETFLRAWRHLDACQQVPEERRRYWLFAIARNLLLDDRRRQAARLRCEMALQECVTAHPCGDDPIHAVIAQETVAAVDAAIAALPDDLRLVLTLHLVGGMTSAEIGRSLQRPAGTVRYQISRARQRVAQDLKLRDTTVDGRAKLE